MLAEDAQAAFSQLETVRPDVILSDIGMPREDGCSFMRRSMPGSSCTSRSRSIPPTW